MKHTSHTSRMRRWLLAGGAVAATSTLLVGCVGTTAADAGAGSTGAGGKTVIQTQINADPDSYLPSVARAGASEAVNGLLYSTLLYQDKDHTIVAGLASEWQATPTEITLTIRKDATCSDGTPITPTVVRNSLQAFAGEDGSSRAAMVFGPESAVFTADDGAGTVSIALGTPWADALQGLTLPAAGIVCPAGLEEPEATKRGEVKGAFSGPYTLGAIKPGSAVTLNLRDDFKAWPEYKTPMKGNPAKTVVFNVNGDISSVANALLTGGLDIAPVSGKAEARFQGNSGFTTAVIPKAAVYVMFNERAGKVFADEDLRRAVAQSFDAVGFISGANGGIGTPATSFVPDTVQCANTDASLLTSKDVAAARKALTGVKVNMIGTLALGAQGVGNTYLQAALTEAGAEVTLLNTDNTTWATDLGTKPDGWDVTIMPLLNTARTIAGGLAPIVGSITEDGGRNYSGTPKVDVQKLIGVAMSAPTPEARCAAYQNVQELVLRRVDLIPITNAQQLNIVKKGFDMRVINGVAAPITMRVVG